MCGLTKNEARELSDGIVIKAKPAQGPIPKKSIA
jgi:polyhydroxyalkanoate synthesis regulator phasin